MESKVQRIFIYGVPGSGKTHLSKVMALDLQVPLLEADFLKKDLKKTVTEIQSPFLYLGTCQAFQRFGTLNLENAVLGLKAVREALAERVKEEIKKHEHENIIIEGAFLDPNRMKDQGEMILVTTPNERKHREQFFLNGGENDLTLSEFKCARIVQEYLSKEAMELGISIQENKSLP